MIKNLSPDSLLFSISVEEHEMERGKKYIRKKKNIKTLKIREKTSLGKYMNSRNSPQDIAI